MSDWTGDCGDWYEPVWTKGDKLKLDTVEWYAQKNLPNINDLVTGGENATLSAEQGKILKEYVDVEITPTIINKIFKTYGWIDFIFPKEEIEGDEDLIISISSVIGVNESNSENVISVKKEENTQ